MVRPWEASPGFRPCDGLGVSLLLDLFRGKSPLAVGPKSFLHDQEGVIGYHYGFPRLVRRSVIQSPSDSQLWYESLKLSQH
jgi:hypothetical protein